MNISFSRTGCVRSLVANGKEYCIAGAATSLFEVQLRDFIGNPLILSANDFENCKIEGGDGNTVVHFAECNRLPGTEVQITVKSDGDALRWRIRVVPGTDDFRTETVDFPRFVLGHNPNEHFLLPTAEGVLVDDLDNRQANAAFRCCPSEYPLTGVSSFYPGPAAMQFEAYYADDEGIGVFFEDPSHCPKTIDAMPEQGGSRFLLQQFIGKEETDYDVVLRPFHGDWQAAAEIYREWMEASDVTLPKKLSEGRLAPWLNEAPVLLAYPVKGHGLDAGGLDPNEFYPYANVLPLIRKYHDAWNCPVMALLMHWEGTAPWAPPYVWPPTGGEDLLKDFIGQMHDNGDLVGLYCSGIGWTQRSMIDPSFSLKKRFEDENVSKEICRGPRGEAYSRVCNGPRGQRIGYDLCPGREFTVKTVTEEIRNAAKAGVDYLQYFDQNQGCTSPLCYGKDHGHPDLPGPWQTTAMQALLDASADAAGDNTILGCENGAAEPYTGVCRLNDLRNHLAWGTGGIPVPLYQYLFHEYTTGFSGNGVCLTGVINQEKTPFFMLWSLAWNFACGNVMTLVLKDGGKFHWSWALPWEVPGPEQEPIIELVANLTAWKRGVARDYLVAGRMQKSPAISCGRKTISTYMLGDVSVPAVICTAWSFGERNCILLVNYGLASEQCAVSLENVKHARVYMQADDSGKFLDAPTASVEVPGLNSVLIEY